MAIRIKEVINTIDQTTVFIFNSQGDKYEFLTTVYIDNEDIKVKESEVWGPCAVEIVP